MPDRSTWKPHHREPHNPLRSVWIAAFLFVGLYTSNLAATPSQQPPYPQGIADQRQRYQDAHIALSKNRLAAFDELTASLTGYPLYPYLVYERWSKNLANLNKNQLDLFYQQFSDTPLPVRLHKKWLRWLSRNKQGATYLANYDERFDSTFFKCTTLWVQHESGLKDKALRQTKQLWLTSRSQPDSCDPLFKSWLASPYFNEDIAWQRFWLAYNDNQIKLARYLTRYLKNPEKLKTSQQALQLHKDPTRLKWLLRSLPSEHKEEIILRTLKQLARTEPAEAIKQLDRLKPHLGKDAASLEALKQSFIFRMVRRFNPDSESWLASINNQQLKASQLEWILRLRLNKQDWEGIDNLIDQLPSDLKYKDRWRYWRARSLDETAKNADSRQRAYDIYRELAKQRSFYGFLSADRLDLHPSLNNRTSERDEQRLEELANQPALIRARELYYNQQYAYARSEWYQGTRNLKEQEHYLAARLARRWGWYAQGIRSAIASKQWDDLLLRFPLTMHELALSASQQHKIDSQLIFAVIRQESAFTTDAISPAGAYGLMQLMPRTAKETARKVKAKYRRRSQLHDPQFNINLGSAYLARLLKRFNGNRALAASAYNAGPHRTGQWLAKRGKLPLDAWIETIPFSETRQYVQNVLSYSAIYSKLLGKTEPFLRPEDRQLISGES